MKKSQRARLKFQILPHVTSSAWDTMTNDQTTTKSQIPNRSILWNPVAVLVTGLFVLTGCKEEDIVQQIEQQLPKITLENFSLTETQKGKKMWTLNACNANVYDDIINVDTVNIKFFNAAGKEYALLLSVKGQLNTKTHDIIVKDSVKLTTDDSTRLFADSLFWQNDSQKILTDSRVRIYKKDGTTIEGRGLKTTPDLKRIEIIGDIKGESPIEFPKIK